MATEQILDQLTIHSVTSPQVYKKMVEAGLVNDGELYFVSGEGAGSSLPEGGSSGQVLSKTEDGEEWKTLEKNDISDFPESLPASDVAEWAKQEEKPTYTAEEVGALAAPSGGSVGQVLMKTEAGQEWASLPSGLPDVTEDDNGKFLRVVDGRWAVSAIPNANGVSF